MLHEEQCRLFEKKGESQNKENGSVERLDVNTSG